MKHSIEKLLTNIPLILMPIGICLGLQAQSFDSKLILGETAKPLTKSTGYIRTVDGIVYDGSYGLSKNFSLGIGTSLFNIFDKDRFYGIRGAGLKGKLTFPINDKIYAGIGLHVIRKFGSRSIDYDLAETNLLPTGMVTIDLNAIELTMSAGITTRFNLADSEKGAHPILSLGYIIPLYKGLNLVNETWHLRFESNYSDKSHITFSALVLRWNYKKISAEGGLMGLYGDDGDGRFHRFFPQVGFSYFLGSSE